MLASASQRLFTIETNNDFSDINVDINPAIKRAVRCYGLNSPTSVSSISKRNPFSQIYRVRVGTEKYILRSVAAELQATTEQQCRIVIALDGDSILRPLESTSGLFSELVDQRAWMIYREIDGDVFTGYQCSPLVVIDQAIELMNSLQQVYQDRTPVEHLSKMQHRPECWMQCLAELANEKPFPQHPSIRESVSQETHQQVCANRSNIEQWISSAAELPVENHSLVHNDLQHANVLIGSGRPFFLDIEDICFENREISIAHAVFKLLRHSVFTGAATWEELRDQVVPAAIERLAKSGFAISNSNELFLYGAYRILSDIWEIVDYTIQEDDSQLYDLEKRICNLFELQLLTSEN